MEKILRRNFSLSLARGTAPNKARKRNERRFTKKGEETESKANNIVGGKSKQRRPGMARGTAPREARSSNGKRIGEEGGPKRPRGRPPGATNVWPREVKEAVEHGVARFGEDGRGKNGFEGFIFRMCALEPKTVMNLVRAMMPTKVTVEHKEEKIESIDDLKKGLESIGLRMEDLRPFKFHTPEQVLELTARDVTDDTNDNNK